MKKMLMLALLLVIAVMPAWAVINNHYRLTQAHAIPTAYTLNKGEVLIGMDHWRMVLPTSFR